MVSDNYLRSVLSNYNLPHGPKSLPEIAASELYHPIKKWAGNWLLEILYSGSYAKGTRVKGSSDLDLFISLKSDTPDNLRVIHDNLFKYMNIHKYSPRPQNVSIGITYRGLSIDLIPGKKQQGTIDDHSIYTSKKASWTKTNITKHVNKIAASGRIEEIRIMKIWRNLNDLDFQSFYLELSVLNSLHNRRIGDLANNVSTVFEYLIDYFISTRIVDPSNTNNIISDDLTLSEKKKIQSAATSARAEKFWKNIIW